MSVRAEANQEPQLLPARMVNEYVYCPRLFWLEHVEREFEESYDTVDGTHIHRRVDRARGALPDDVEQFRNEVTSVDLSSEHLGVVAKIDLIREEDGAVVPVDYKRGVLPEHGPYDSDRVQVCIQALLLREAGYRCDRAKIYYAASKAYADVEIDDALIGQTRAAIVAARQTMNSASMPAPLLDSPKCGRCSLHAICLPDETNALRLQRENRAIRPYGAPHDDKLPLYVLTPGARVGLSGETLEIRTEESVIAAVPLVDVASVSLFGNTQISTQAMRAVLLRDLPVFYLSYGGWLIGYTRSVNDHSLDVRIVQHEVAREDNRCLPFARAFVFGKVKNQRTMVRRALRKKALKSLQALSMTLHRIRYARSHEELLGLEGTAARLYFGAFGEMLKVGTGFEVTGRNRRPPTDPVNALLSFGYAMLLREAVAAAVSVGLEPGLGLYHRLRAGRPSLALDLMEEFRPLIVDSTVLAVINTGEIEASHFDRRGRAIVLTDEGRRVFIAAIERRLRAEIIHPVFKYKVSYRRALHVQARLLARALQGDIPVYPAFCTR